MRNARDIYAHFVKSIREIAVLESIGSILSWDQETQMPEKGAELRAQQFSLVARMAHEQFTSPKIEEMLNELSGSDLIADPESDAAVNFREVKRAFDRQKKIPSSLIEEMSKTAVLAHSAWVEARKKSNFPLFQPWLEKTLDLKRQEAKCVGHAGHIYNALLDPFEQGETAEGLTKVFEELRTELIELVGKITSSNRKAPVEILERHYPAAAQAALAREASEKIGFDFSAGRLDISVHPFCSSIGPGDTRMTTRYDEKYFGDAFFGVLHETGHGLYEQGLPQTHWGTPRAQYTSLGIHESQSRLWENFVGRSAPFWRYFFPKVQQAFPEATKDVSEGQWVFAVNDVRPSLIRTEADEATYNLHVLLRFEIEQAMLSGDLPVGQIPQVWRSKIKQYLGLEVPDEARGCLQDVHWSHGSIGYFPTYTLGNLYAAQFYQKAKQDIGGMEEGFGKGDFTPLLNWLRQNIHAQGKKYRARDLVKRITGKDLEAGPLLRHLKQKASDLYGV
jgi:carboxypeptidase Taq